MNALTQKILPRIPRIFLVFMVLLFLSLLNFGPSLRGEFMIDDFGLIKDSSFVSSSSLKNWHEHFVPDFKAKQGIENSSSAVYYRPVAHLVPFLQSLAFGDDPLGYRVTNLFLLIAACLCFYVLLTELTGNRPLAFFAVTIFCLHPINGMMVNYITASVYAIQLIFLSLSLYLYIRSNLRNFLYFFSAGMFFVSLLCHETSLMFPAYVILVSWYRQKDLWRAIKKAWLFLLIAVVYFGMRLYFTDLQSSVFGKYAIYDGINFFNYVATFFKLLAWYFSKLVSLQGMVIIASTPLVKDHLYMWLGGGVLAVAATGFVVFKQRNNTVSFFILWFILGLVPVTAGSMFLPRTGMMIEPHWLFFASLGLFVLFAGFVLSFLKKFLPRLRALGCLSVGIILLTASWNNNVLWQDELTFTRHWAREFPNDKNALFRYAGALLKSGRLPQAKYWFRKALMDEHSDWQNYNNLAQIALDENDEELALQYYHQALAVFPQSAAVHNNLGSFYSHQEDYAAAERYLRKAQLLNPYQVEPLLNLGLVFEKQGRWDQAVEAYRRAYQLRPKDERVLYSLLRVTLLGHDPVGIVVQPAKSLQLIKGEKYLNEIGGLLAMRGQNSAALQYFTKAIKLYPQSTDAYRESGKVLANAGYYEGAEKMWKEALRAAPAKEEFSELLRQLEEIKASVAGGTQP